MNLKRILLGRIGALGDTLMALPVARFLKEESGLDIDFLCTEKLTSLVKMSPWVDRVYGLKGRNLPFLLSVEKQRLARRLADNRYHRAVLMESAPSFLSLLERSAIPSIQSFLSFPFASNAHSTVNNLRLAGASIKISEPRSVDLDLPEPENQDVLKCLEGLPSPIIGLHPGYGLPQRKAAQSKKHRGWPPKSFISLGQALQNMGASIVLTGSSEDGPDCQKIAQDLDRSQTRILAGQTTLPQLAGLIRELQLFVSVDSGPAHLCAAVGTPLIVLWGPGKWIQTRPISNGGEIILLRKKLPCSPCYDTPAMKTCLKNICMEFIRADEVLSHCQKVLGQAP